MTLAERLRQQVEELTVENGYLRDEVESFRTIVLAMRRGNAQDPAPPPPVEGCGKQWQYNVDYLVICQPKFLCPACSEPPPVEEAPDLKALLAESDAADDELKAAIVERSQEIAPPVAGCNKRYPSSNTGNMLTCCPGWLCPACEEAAR